MPETEKDQSGVLAIENTNLKSEVERLKKANESLAAKLEEQTSAVTLRAEKVKELTTTIQERDEKITALETDLTAAKAGTLAASDLTVEGMIAGAREKLLKLNDTLPCIENNEAIRRLTDAGQWLDRRTSLRQIQKVEGTLKPHKSSI